jgi:hypothetical protein
MVLWHREKVAELNRARVGALEDFKKNGAQRKAAETEKFQFQQKQLVTEATELWKKSVSEPYERLPKYFKPVEGDAKGNELLQKGFEQATKAFKVMQVFDPSLTPEQRQEAIKGHAVVFNKAAAFDRLAYLNGQNEKRIKELSEQLKQYEDSTPTGGTNGRRNGKPVQHGSALDTADAALAALAGR